MPSKSIEWFPEILVNYDGSGMLWHRFLWNFAALMRGCTTLKVLAGAADGLSVAKGRCRFFIPSDQRYFSAQVFA